MKPWTAETRLRRVGLSSMLTLALGVLACAPSGGDEAGLDPVRAIVLPYLTNVPFHIAAEEGYFLEQGLDVEFIRLTRHQEVMTALVTGDVDVAAGMITANELNLASRGERVRMVAALGELSPADCSSTSVWVRRELLESGALEDPERIRRLRFDIDVTLPFGYWADVLLNEYGLSIDDVDTVNVTPPALLGSMMNETIDVTVESTPVATLLEDAGVGVVWRPISELNPGYVLSGVTYGPDLLDRRRDVGERFAVAILKAVRQFRLGKTERNLQIAQRATGVEREVLEKACWPLMTEDAGIDPDIFVPYQEWSVARGLLDRVVEADELFDLRFIARANEILER